jgi:nucleoside-diphosphate kinase
MAIERTFAIIKANAVISGSVGQIISEIERAELTLRGMRLARLTPEICKEFYQEHVGKPFYPTLEAFMVEGPVVLLCLEGENAILRWRDLMGATDPAKAAPGTLRAKFGESHTRNATHGSDSPASASRELGFFFGAYDLV